MGIGERLSGGMSKVRERQRARSEARFAERFSAQFTQQWAQLRAERRHEEAEPDIEAGPSNFSRAQVPYGVDLVAAWSWRFLVIIAASYVVIWVLARFSAITIPLVIALLLAALAAPMVDGLHKAGLNRAVASVLAVFTLLTVVGLLLTFVGQQIAQGFSDLSKQVVDALDQIRVWLQEGPLQASESQISDFITEAQRAIVSGNEQAIARVTEVGTALSYVVAGLFLVLFATYFFLADGARIWAWVVRLFPRAARTRADSSGRAAWFTLTKFVRATVLVALVDAVGIMLVAFALNVPLAFAIGVLVFVSSFVPLVGATLSGAVAVLVALVAQGPFVALLMLIGVIVVQQVESNVLQPFLLGRMVSVHPLGVLVAIACGILVAGVAGALIAVPLVAALNAVAVHLSGETAAPPDVVAPELTEPPPPGTPA
ncbi:MAG TPA: AI-2E family transporter [Nocardioidaceae bacterium]|nr:AI-2E family transporter [Nocardioidaceae bacterium]